MKKLIQDGSNLQKKTLTVWPAFCVLQKHCQTSPQPSPVKMMQMNMRVVVEVRHQRHDKRPTKDVNGDSCERLSLSAKRLTS
jgi:hypothetical protein